MNIETVKKIQELVWLADVNLLICEKIYKTLPENRINTNKFILLSANNAFNESIGILHTLLCSTKDEELVIRPVLKEIINKEKDDNVLIDKQVVDRFVEKILEDYPSPDYFSYAFLSSNDKRLIGDVLKDIRKKKRQTSLEDLDELKNEFEQNDFHKIRHQSVAHKNKHLDNPAGATDLYLKEGYIKNLGIIIKKLRINSYFWFDYELRNPHHKTVSDMEACLGRVGR